jgi:hypothetical protein
LLEPLRQGPRERERHAHLLVALEREDERAQHAGDGVLDDLRRLGGRVGVDEQEDEGDRTHRQPMFAEPDRERDGVARGRADVQSQAMASLADQFCPNVHDRPITAAAHDPRAA